MITLENEGTTSHPLGPLLFLRWFGTKQKLERNPVPSLSPDNIYFLFLKRVILIPGGVLSDIIRFVSLEERQACQSYLFWELSVVLQKQKPGISLQKEKNFVFLIIPAADLCRGQHHNMKKTPSPHSAILCIFSYVHLWVFFLIPYCRDLVTILFFLCSEQCLEYYEHLTIKCCLSESRKQ